MRPKNHTGTFDIGRRSECGWRANNEDAVLLVEEWPQTQQRQRRVLGRLYVVADGVGGNDEGEVASAQVVLGLMQHYYNGEYPQGIGPPERLQRAIQATSRAIFDRALGRGTNMRSTLVAALLLDLPGERHSPTLIIANVGDSHGLLFRRGEPPRKLSQDHLRPDGSLAQAMGDQHVNATIYSEPLRADDTLLLCSDGLTDGECSPLSPATIERVLQSGSAQKASNELVRLAGQAGSTDNITAVVIRNCGTPSKSLATPGILALLALLLAASALVAPALLGLLPLFTPGSPVPQASGPPGSNPIFSSGATLAMPQATATIMASATIMSSATPEPAPAIATPVSAPATAGQVGPPTRTPRLATQNSTPSALATATTSPATPSPPLLPTTADPDGPLLMPDLQRLGENDAKGRLIALGVDPALIVVDHQDRARLGRLFDQFTPYSVVSTRPKPGALVVSGAQIVLGVRAPEYEPVATAEPLLMPSLQGMGENEARGQLVALGVDPALIVVDRQDRARLGQHFDQFAPYSVVSTRPQNGAVIAPGTQIVLGVRAPE